MRGEDLACLFYVLDFYRLTARSNLQTVEK